MGVRGLRHAPATLPQGRFNPVPTCIGGWMGPRPVWTGTENPCLTVIRSPNRPARIESIYLLRYPSPPHLHSDIRKIAISGNLFPLEIPDKTILLYFRFIDLFFFRFVNYNLLNRSVILEIISVVKTYACIVVFCVLIPCFLVGEYQCFGGILLPYFGGLYYFITEQEFSLISRQCVLTCLTHLTRCGRVYLSSRKYA